MVDHSTLLTSTSLEWLECVRSEKWDFTLLQRACYLAEQLVYLTHPRDESLLTQGFMMGSQLQKLRCDSETLAAALLYPSFHAVQPSQEYIEKVLNTAIYKMLLATERMEAIDIPYNPSSALHSPENQMDNWRKMLLSMVDDIRIVLIKLAERLVTLMNAKNHPVSEKTRIAQQAMQRYGPLANRLGLGELKWQLEDWSFRYLHPEDYVMISRALNMRRKDREYYIQKVIHELQLLLQSTSIQPIALSGRAKHIYSIYRKIQRKKIHFEQLYDISAIRILVPELQDCYTVLSTVHATWPPILKEFDDYIAKPKPNGYRSIHTAVIGPEQRNVEIQIRTYAMHEESELGFAAHWKYKEGGPNTSNVDDKIRWLQEVIRWQTEIGQAALPPHASDKNIFDNRVFVFTPQGDVLDLAAGATPLDFAYHIHTDIGHRCRGAKINDHIAPLTQPLKNGDRVEILTTKVIKPSRDWLNPHLGYLKTNAAKAKIRYWFKKQERQSNSDLGKLIWEKAVRRHALPKQALEKLCQAFHFPSINDLWIALGENKMGINTLLHHWTSLHAEPSSSEKKISAYPSTSVLNITLKSHWLTQLARCCHPIPGDAILGYITTGRGITLHRRNCNNLKSFLQRRPERIIAMNWEEGSAQKYRVTLLIESNDRLGLLRDISTVFTNEQVPLLGLNSHVDTEHNRGYVYAAFEIVERKSLEKIIRALKQIPGVIDARRFY